LPWQKGASAPSQKKKRRKLSKTEEEALQKEQEALFEAARLARSS
jgi:hypothetical protein